MVRFFKKSWLCHCHWFAGGGYILFLSMVDWSTKEKNEQRSRHSGFSGSRWPMSVVLIGVFIESFFNFIFMFWKKCNFFFNLTMAIVQYPIWFDLLGVILSLSLSVCRYSPSCPLFLSVRSRHETHPTVTAAHTRYNLGLTLVSRAAPPPPGPAAAAAAAAAAATARLQRRS